ncbi:MAG: hypothetical protein K9L78_02090, partial [Victivallales bacterium]|nr:hypothetical protein [Victivallales bacterium]
SDEGSGLYEFNPISFFDGSVNAVSDGVYLMDIQSEYLDIGDGEYGLDGPLSGGFPNGEHSVEFGTEFIGGPSYIEQEFNREYDGIINLSMDFDYDSFDFEAIAAYNREKPAAFMTELDEVLEMV